MQRHSVLLSSLAIHPYWAPSCCAISPLGAVGTRVESMHSKHVCLNLLGGANRPLSLLVHVSAGRHSLIFVSDRAGLAGASPSARAESSVSRGGAAATVRFYSGKRPLWCCGWRSYSSCVVSRIYTNPPEPSLSPPPPAVTPPLPPPPSWPSEKAIGLFICCQWKLLLFLEHDEERRGVAESYPCVGSGADTVPALAASHSLPPKMIFWHLFTDRPQPQPQPHPPQRTA